MNTFRNPETKKFVSNKRIYELMGCQTLSEYIKQTKNINKIKATHRVNPNIQRVLGYYRET